MSTFGSGTKTSFERSKNDFYATPEKAVLPLLPHLKKNTKFIEPCAGDGQLVNILEKYGHKCELAIDIEPRNKLVSKGNAADIQIFNDYDIITNPPFKKALLEPILNNWWEYAKVCNDFYLLLPAAFMHNLWPISYLEYCSDIISIGRVKWFPGSKYSSTDDFAWYKFISDKTSTTFHGRNTQCK